MADALFLTGMTCIAISVTAENVRTILDGTHILFRI